VRAARHVSLKSERMMLKRNERVGLVEMTELTRHFLQLSGVVWSAGYEIPWQIRDTGHPGVDRRENAVMETVIVV